MTSYFCGFPEGKYVSGVMHWKSVNLPCIRRASSMEDIEGLFQITERILDMNAGLRLAVEN